MRHKLLLRWTLGDPSGGETHPEGLECLRRSLVWASRVWPSARRVVCVNGLRDNSRKFVTWLSGEGLAEVLEAPTPPEYLRAGDVSPLRRNGFKKFYPLRVDRSAYEVVMDNDVMIWRSPPTLLNWLSTDKILISGFNYGKNPPRPKTSSFGYASPGYGNYNKEIQERISGVSLSTGIIGWPPGSEGPSFLTAPKYAKVFIDEQGSFTLNLLDQNLSYLILPYSEVGVLEEWHRSGAHDPSLLLSSFCGIHVASVNRGKNTAWTRFFEPFADPDLL